MTSLIEIELQPDGSVLAHGPTNPMTLARRVCEGVAPYDPESFAREEARVGDRPDLPSRLIHSWDDLGDLLAEVGVALVWRWGVLYAERLPLH